VSVAAASHHLLTSLIILCLDLHSSAHEQRSVSRLLFYAEPGGQAKMLTSALKYSSSRWRHSSLCQKQPFSTVFPAFGLMWSNGLASSSEQSFRGEYFLHAFHIFLICEKSKHCFLTVRLVALIGGWLDINSTCSSILGRYCSE